VVEGYLTAALALWLSVTILCQLPGELPQALRALDLLSLIPRWYLFAPHPLRFDYVLVYRAGRPPDQLTDWSPVQWCTQVPPSLAPLVNPARRETKVLLDVVQELLVESSGPRRARTSSTGAYRYLLSVASEGPAGGCPEAMIQFAVLRVRALPEQGDHVRAVFISRWHELRDAVGART
jgi:hypothetical protein